MRFIWFIISFWLGNCFAAPVSSTVHKLVTTCSCTSCDLRHAKLADFYLGQYPAQHEQKDKLNECQLSRANFSWANLANASFIGAGRSYALNIDLQQTRFTHAKLIKATFYRVNGQQANFGYANLRNASLAGCNFAQADFSHANMQKIFTLDQRQQLGANLAQANFSHANLSYARLDAMLDQTNFSYANLDHAQLNPAVNDISGIVTTGFAGSNFSHAKLTQAKLYEIVGTLQPFAKTDFSYANLLGAKLMQGSPLANPTTVNLDAAILCHTTLPDGKISNRDCRIKRHG